MVHCNKHTSIFDKRPHRMIGFISGYHFVTLVMVRTFSTGHLNLMAIEWLKSGILVVKLAKKVFYVTKIGDQKKLPMLSTVWFLGIFHIWSWRTDDCHSCWEMESTQKNSSTSIAYGWIWTKMVRIHANCNIIL